MDDNVRLGCITALGFAVTTVNNSDNIRAKRVPKCRGRLYHSYVQSSYSSGWFRSYHSYVKSCHSCGLFQVISQLSTTLSRPGYVTAWCHMTQLRLNKSRAVTVRARQRYFTAFYQAITTGVVLARRTSEKVE